MNVRLRMYIAIYAKSLLMVGKYSSHRSPIAAILLASVASATAPRSVTLVDKDPSCGNENVESW